MRLLRDSKRRTPPLAPENGDERGMNLAMEGSVVEPLSATKDNPHQQSAYIYPSLDYTRDPDAIRLLQVSPDLLDGYIQVELRQAPSGTIRIEKRKRKKHEAEPDGFERPPEFHCLSYTWGAPTLVHEILLNGCVFPVRTNLFDFLDVARRLHTSKYLWIDALCIDQNNIRERGHQVQRMSHIYRAATEVLIWLGASPALELVAACLNQHEKNWKLPASTRKHFVEVISHPYWGRAWITQEILLAQSVQIMHNSGTISWSRFGDLLDARYHQKLETVRMIQFLELMRWYRPVSVRMPVLLMRQCETACTNKRDRLYSMLGLLEAGNNFPVDYEEPIVDLFWRAGEHFHLWHCSSVKLLQVALDMGIENLRDSVRRTTDRLLTLPLHRAYYGKRQFPRRTGMTRCRHEKLEVPYGGPFHHQVLFCTYDVRSQDFMHSCSHVILSRGSKSDSDIRCTLVARSGDLFWTIRLEDAVLQTLLMIAYAGAKRKYSPNEWLEIMHWDQLRKLLRLNKKGRCLDKWELKIPARYIVEQLDFF